MKNERLKQFVLSFFVVLSLLASSVSAACTCASRELEASEHSHCEPQQSEHSAHEYSHEMSGEHARENSTGNVLISFSETDDCCCVRSAPRVFAKTESVKIEKQTAAIATSFSPIGFAPNAQIAVVETVDFITPFYLSDSFHNLTPGRAPPRF